MSFFLYAIYSPPHPEERFGVVEAHLERRTADFIAMSYVGAFLYILLCADRSYYVGIARESLEKRFHEHEAGTFDGYTKHRRPVEPVFHHYFEWIEDAISR